MYWKFLFRPRRIHQCRWNWSHIQSGHQNLPVPAWKLILRLQTIVSPRLSPKLVQKCSSIPEGWSGLRKIEWVCFHRRSIHQIIPCSIWKESKNEKKKCTIKKMCNTHIERACVALDLLVTTNMSACSEASTYATWSFLRFMHNDDRTLVRFFELSVRQKNSPSELILVATLFQTMGELILSISMLCWAGCRNAKILLSQDGPDQTSINQSVQLHLEV